MFNVVDEKILHRYVYKINYYIINKIYYFKLNCCFVFFLFIIVLLIFLIFHQVKNNDIIIFKLNKMIVNFIINQIQ